jgi:hypothetical protein
MARLLTCGFEANDVTIDGIGGTTGTSLVRSGARAMTSVTANFVSTGVHGTTYYARAYYHWTAWPTSGTGSSLAFTGTNVIQIRVSTSGLLTCVPTAGTIPGSFQASLNTWYRLELAGRTSASASSTYGEWYVDGSSLGSSSTLNMTAVWAGMGTQMGLSGLTGAVDDVAYNDSNGASQNGLPGAAKVVLLLPISDNALGTGWTNDNLVNTTTNLWECVNNTPPIGIADTTSSTTSDQNRNATASANSNYDANLTTYTTAGIASGDTINVLDPIVATAAPVTTSAKQGTVGVSSNPVIANVALSATGTSGAFWAGATAGTYPTGWKASHGTATYAPSVTLGSSPVLRITQVTSSTRIAMVCFMGLYVDYTPAPAAGQVPYISSMPQLLAQ